MVVYQEGVDFEVMAMMAVAGVGGGEMAMEKMEARVESMEDLMAEVKKVVGKGEGESVVIQAEVSLDLVNAVMAVANVVVRVVRVEGQAANSVTGEAPNMVYIRNNSETCI